jgi:hypothetical protein
MLADKSWIWETFLVIKIYLRHFLAIQSHVIGNRVTSSSVIEGISEAYFENANGKSDSPEGNGKVPFQSSFRVSVRNRVNILTYFTRKCGMSKELSRQSHLSERLPAVASR